MLISEKEDPEESALTLNGKKRKFNPADFRRFATSLGLNEKQTNNVFKRFAKAIPEAVRMIERGFLPDKKMKEFKGLLEDRAARMGLA